MTDILSKFSSIWAPELTDYIKERRQAGFKFETGAKFLLRLDEYLCTKQLNEKIFTREMAEETRHLRPGEALSSRYQRICTQREFWQRMVELGHTVCVPLKVSKRFPKFEPHIYTHEEIERYFGAVDTYDYGAAGRMSIALPVAFRLMYCLALRISEVLGLRKCDIDFEHGFITIRVSKNGKERRLPLSEELLDLLEQYANKTFYLLGDNSFIFPSQKLGMPVTAQTIGRYHREFLHSAGIPYVGEGKGPRIHDFRHTAAVYMAKQLIDSGMDMYAALPWLSQFLGHSSTHSTEYYLRLAVDLYPSLTAKMDQAILEVLKGMEVPYEIE